VGTSLETMSSDRVSGENPKDIIRQLGLKPLRSLGQNFMMDGSVIRDIVEHAAIDPERDALIEVGPGTGALTSRLVETGAPLLCVELDRGLAQYLQETYGSKGVRIFQGDILASKHAFDASVLDQLRGWKEEGRRIKWISNLPYNILTPLLWNLLQVRELWQSGIFLVQSEFAQRMRSAPGHDAYGPLGVMSSLYLSCKTLRPVPRRCFWPVPEVDSAVIRIDPIIPAPRMEVGFQDFLKLAFSQRRKKLSKLVASGEISSAGVEALLEKMGYPAEARGESLVAGDFLLLYEQIYKTLT